MKDNKNNDLDYELLNLKYDEPEIEVIETQEEKSEKLKLAEKNRKKRIRLYSAIAIIILVALMQIGFNKAQEVFEEYAVTDEIQEAEQELAYDPNFIGQDDLEGSVGDGEVYPEGTEIIEVKDSTIPREEIYSDESKAIQTVLELVEEQDYEEANRIALSIQSEAGIALQNDINLILNIEDPNYFIEADAMLPFFMSEDIVARYYLNYEDKAGLVYLQETELIASDEPMIYEKYEIEPKEVPWLVRNFTNDDLETTKFFRYEIYINKYYPMYDLYIALSSACQTKVYYGAYQKGDDGEYHRQDGSITYYIPTRYSDDY